MNTLKTNRTSWRSPPSLSWCVLPFVALMVGDFWIFSRLGRESADLTMIGSLFAHITLNSLAIASLLASWWGFVSLVTARFQNETKPKRAKKQAALVLGFTIFAFSFVLLESRMKPGLGFGIILSTLGSILLLGFLLAAQNWLTERGWINRVLLFVVTLNCALIVVLFGASEPPVFSKIVKEPLTLLICSLLFWIWIYQVMTRPLLSSRRASVTMGGGLLLWVVASAGGANLSKRSTHVVTETFEGSRALRAFNRKVGELVGMDGLWSSDLHSKLAGRSVKQPECGFRMDDSYSNRCLKLMAQTSCDVPEDAKVESLLLLSVDSLRSDYFGVRTADLPVLDSLIQSSLVFDRVAQTGSGTAPSIFTMHTGRYPMQASPVVDAWPALARAAKGKSHLMLQGWKRGRPTQNAASFTDDIISELKNAARENRPFFIHAHYLSLHIVGLDDSHDYAALLSQWDVELGRILAELATLGLTKKTAVIVTGDHGEESRQEHGYMGHGYGVWETSVVTPLLINAPNITPRRYSTRVSGVDIWPTALNLLGASCAYTMHGSSLLEPLPPNRPVFSSSYTKNPTSQVLLFSDIHSVVVDDWKLIMDLRGGSSALYNLSTDPGERHNLADDKPERLRLLSEMIRDHLVE